MPNRSRYSRSIDRSPGQHSPKNGPVGHEGSNRRGQKLNIWILLQAARRRWLLASFLGLFFGGVAAATIWFLLPPANPIVYSWIYIPEKISGNWAEHPDPPLQRQTQAALIKNPFLLTAVLRSEEVAKLSIVKEQPKPDEWLAHDLRIEFPSGPEIMQISMSGDRPGELKIIVNAIREKYYQDTRDESRGKRAERLKHLAEYEATTKADIDHRRDNLKKKAKEGNDVDGKMIANRVEVDMKLLEQTNRELTHAKSELRRMQIDEKLLQEDNPKTLHVPETLIEEEIKKHAGMLPLLKQQEELDAKLRLWQERAPTNPQITHLKDEGAALQKKIDAKKDELRPTVEAALRDRLLTNRQAEMTALGTRVREYKEWVNELIKASDQLVKQTKDANTQFLTVEDEVTQITLLEKLRERLIVTKEQLQAEESAPLRIFKYGDEPTISTIDETTRHLRFAALGGMAALGLVVLIVALLEIRVRRLNSPEDVVDSLGMPVVGTVPAPPKRFAKALTDQSSEPLWQAMLTESVDSFRTQLLHTARKNSLQVVMVSSASSGEGKTSLSCHLAVSLARSGLKTLLVDADLRNPSAHELFQLTLEPGLCEMLQGNVPGTEAIRRSPVTGLWILPAGKCTPRVLELLAQEPLTRVFAELREGFDFIIVDSSPILPVTDPLIFAQQSDGVIFSFMREVTRLGAARAAIDRLHALNVVTLGAVVSGIHPTSYGYNHRKYAYPANN